MESTTYRPVTIGNWMLTYLLMCIPVVNLVLLFVWAFGGAAPESKANWAKASLIWMAIGIAMFVLFVILMSLGVPLSDRMQ